MGDGKALNNLHFNHLKANLGGRQESLPQDDRIKNEKVSLRTSFHLNDMREIWLRYRFRVLSRAVRQGKYSFHPIGNTQIKTKRVHGERNALNNFRFP